MYIHIFRCVCVCALCQVDVRDTVSEWTPLMRVSAMSGNAAVASLLIQAGADVNVRDKDGKTPLMVLQNGYVQKFCILLSSQNMLFKEKKKERGCLLKLCCLYQVAVLNNHEELVKLLLDSGADQHVTNMVQIELKLLLKYASKQLHRKKLTINKQDTVISANMSFIPL